MHPPASGSTFAPKPEAGWNSSIDSEEGAPAAIMRSSFGIRYGPLPPANNKDETSTNVNAGGGASSSSTAAVRTSGVGGPGDYSSLKLVRRD
jgi:hypothetical protein